ncbi:MAG: hypothetical protein U1B78_08100, partial [Dehalococcoidia bacterium]|nr:hypothetical protein [Dehalococcoidia bacterium]
MRATLERRRRLILAFGLMAFVAAMAVLAAWPSGPNEAEASGATMSLRVFGDAAKTQLVCDVGAIQRKCEVESGSVLVAEVVATSPPAKGYEAYQTVFQYSSNLTLKQQPDLAENKLGTCVAGTETKATPSGSSPGVYQLDCKVSELTHHAGPLTNVAFTCSPQQSSGQLVLVGGAAANVSVYINPSFTGSLVFLKSQNVGGVQAADAVTITCASPPTDTPTHTPANTPTRTPTITPTATEPAGDEGCTPGYWKNHLVPWEPTGFDPQDSFENAFGTAPDPFSDDPGMLEVLDLGGGGINALSRHAAAALLNASHPSLAYPLSPAAVIAAYQTALASGDPSVIEAQKDTFDRLNNAG